MGHGLEGDLACEGLSVYANRLGQKVASGLISVVDDATLAGKRGSFTFDDEGCPAKRTVLIENGALKSYPARIRQSKTSKQPIDVFSVTYFDDDDEQGVLVNFIDYPVVSNTNPI